MQKWQHKLSFLIIFLFLFSLSGCVNTNAANNGLLKVHYIDVGQADSIFIELPDSKNMLIDAGNNPDGELVVDYIKNLGYSKIDYIIGTHPHEDHIGGMDNVIDSFEIGNVYLPKTDPGQTPTTKTYESVLTSIQNKGLKITAAKSGVSIFSSDSLKADFIAPNSDSYENLNNYSAVIKLTYGSNSFLFTGDAEKNSESEITADIKADVLKVGHHGSSTSTSDSFLQKVDPSYAVISVGTNNKYGHPAAETIETLQNAGVKIYRTDELGSILITSDGNNITVNGDSSESSKTISPSSKTLVYVTPNGKSYHNPECQYVKNNASSLSLSEAKTNYTPCSKCNPPK